LITYEDSTHANQYNIYTNKCENVLENMYVDLHIHFSCYPGASKDLTLENLAKFTKLKGLDLVGTGDSLLPK